VSSSDQNITVYTPDSPLRYPLRLIATILREIWQARELVGILFGRDIKAAYRQSYFGYFWIIAQPLMTAGIWIFLSSNEVVNTGDTGIPKPAYILIGTTLWSIFNAAFNAPMGGFGGGSAVFMKLKVTPEAFIASNLAKVFFDSTIRFVIIILPCLVIFQLFAGWHLLLFPFALLTIVIFGTALGYLLIPIGGLYSDVNRAIGLAMPVLMYTTPVVYTIPTTKNLLYYIMEWNPITPLIMTGRDWLTTGPSLYTPELLAITIISLPILIIGMIILRVAMPHLIVRMGM
jgi:lipopolysaccharide transport system permease protein